jgi:hypothetical protein
MWLADIMEKQSFFFIRLGAGAGAMARMDVYPATIVTVTVARIYIILG